MNKIKMLGYKVSFFNITAIILVIIAISLMITNQLSSITFDVYADKEKKLIDSVRMYKDASDYLTKKAFAYICSGNDSYYKSYMKEAYEIKRRQTAVNNIKSINVGEEGEKLIEEIDNYSNELMVLEETAMDLMHNGRIDLAKEKLFSDEYENKADNIASNVEKFEKLVRKDIKHHLDTLQGIINFTFIGELIISLIIIVVIPLRNIMTKQLIYVDSLTNMENRIAFEKYIDKYESTIKGMAFLDVNELKQTNDNLGHRAGDELLANVSKCIKKVFKEYGRLYRISGDEFIVVFEKDINETELLNKFEEECNKMSNSLGNKIISASCGFAIQDFKNPISKEDLYVIAEKNMYIAKSQFYKKSNIDRRIR